MRAVTATGLVVGRACVPCAVPVFNWFDHGMEFKYGRGARRRNPKQKINLLVFHWTGGEGTMKGLHRVLTARELGVEFGVNRQGAVYQFADPATHDTFDAGHVNPRSAGVEMVNYGFVRGSKKPPRRGRDRTKSKIRIHRRTKYVADFYPEQLRAALALANALCDALEIPRRLPRDARGRILSTAMPRKQLKAFEGVVGHFHITKRKTDPGLQLLEYLSENGFS